MKINLRSLFLVTTLSAPLLAQAATLDSLFVAEPYLQNPSTTGITVMFQTRQNSHAWVEYGPDTLKLKRARTLIDGQASVHDIESKIRLDSLAPSTYYYYRICAQPILVNKSYHKEFGTTAYSSFYRFKTAPVGEADFTAFIFNDLHQIDNVYAALLEAAGNIKPDFCVFNGDCLPEPSTREEAMMSINKLARRANGAEQPLFFVRGNHEIRNAYSSGSHSLFDNPGGKTYGAFTWGNSRFVFLDCGEDKPDDTWVYYGLNDFTALRREQAAFLQSELKSREFRKAKERVLISHIPVFGNVDKYQPCTEQWGDILEKAPFNVYLAGHTHRYKFHESGTAGARYPVVVGGGPGMTNATLVILTKKSGKLTLKIVDPEGKILKESGI